MLERSFLLALLSIWMAMPAFAVNDWGSTIFSESAAAEVSTDCQSGRSVGGGGKICFDLNASLSPAETSFSVAAPSALACFRPDWQVEGVPGTASPGTAVIRYAPSGYIATTALSGIQACAAAGCTLTGLNGTPTSQLICVVLGPGAYRIDFPTLPDATDIGLFTVQGAPN